jgi:hypothetical protein
MKKKIESYLNKVIYKIIFYLGFIIRLFIHFNILKSKNIKITDRLRFSSNMNNIFFKNEIKKSRFYLEFGSGRSTLFAQKIKKKFISIEGDKIFFNIMKKKINNPSLRYYNIGLTYQYSIPYFYYQKLVLNYSKSIFEELQRKKIVPDLILIDGRFRVLVALQAHIFMSKIKKIIRIIIDDYAQRYHYHILENFFKIKVIGNFGVVYGLKNKKITKKLIEKYLRDHR